MENAEISSHDWSILNEIITEIYSASPQPDLLRVISKLKKVVGFSRSLACLISNRDDNIEFFEYVSDDIPEDHLQIYRSKYVHFDFMLWYCAAPEELVFRESDIIVGQYMDESIFMREWLEPIGAHYGAGMNIAGAGHSFGNICLYRSKQEGDFSLQDIMILRVINGHLCIRFRNLFPRGIQRDSFKRQQDMLSSTYHLTKRESELVQLVCQGVSRAALSAELCLSESTIKKHLNSIYKKLGISGFEELLRFVTYDTSILGTTSTQRRPPKS